MQGVTAVRQAIQIPRLFTQSEQGMAQIVMAAWAKKQNKSIAFEAGRNYIAVVDGARYRFQCQRYTENSGYGFLIQSFRAQNITGILLFRQSKQNRKKYLWYCCSPDQVAAGRTEGRCVITPSFAENNCVYIIL